ncbi:zinc finger-like domain-containing protein [Bosea lathyri]|uniref:Uncharacterized protein n=1 Tax=Bosea lathyri TaxID=1036778 RepID=A0A1H6BV53_9HYPH|nr:zinc finger-like domain-containing protein [Bosea lathyri]SEG64512.1 hypothetical protein SAMN04488115_108102 [Bosea lathyri]
MTANPEATWRVVPAEAIDWLMGAHPDGFERPEGARGNFWWRTEFSRRAMLKAAPVPGREEEIARVLDPDSWRTYDQAVSIAPRNEFIMRTANSSVAKSQEQARAVLALFAAQPASDDAKSGSVQCAQCEGTGYAFNQMDERMEECDDCGHTGKLDIDGTLVRNLVGLAILDGENIGRWAKDREPAETLALREASLNGRTGQIFAAFTKPASDDASDIDSRMVAAGMIPLSDLISGNTPLERWTAHTGVSDLDTFEQWLNRRQREFGTMRVGYELGDKDKADELYEWVHSHFAAFNEVAANLRQMKRRMAEAPTKPASDDAPFGYVVTTGAGRDYFQRQAPDPEHLGVDWIVTPVNAATVRSKS